MNHIVIRELIGLDQIATIYPLYRQNGSASESVFRERLTTMLGQGNYRCIAAFAGDTMLAISGFWTGTSFWTGKYLEPDHVVVDAASRSRGIGATLLTWMEAEAVRLGCDIVKIAMLLGKDRTRNFYRRNGYSDDGLSLVKPLSAWAEAEFPDYAAHKAGTAG